MKFFLPCIFFICIAHLAVCSEDAILHEGDSLTIKNESGVLVINAEHKLKRCFTWNGQTRSVVMLERNKQWLGSKSIYFPGPGQHWAEHDGVTRGVVEEGKRSFNNSAEFLKWIRHDYQRYLHFQFLGRGRIGGWAIVRDRKQLSCAVWEIQIDGKLLSEIQFHEAIKE